DLLLEGRKADGPALDGPDRSRVVASWTGGLRRPRRQLAMAEPTSEKFSLTLSPRKRTAMMATTAIRATRRPYSTMEAPFSSRTSFASSQLFRMYRFIGVSDCSRSAGVVTSGDVRDIGPGRPPLDG